ncbi:MAG: hypothetical protein CSA21_00540 [Deltaproteobacteria bacterium]|nr:MAG: hypothetical protein CSA21_00540 [Deltaproteobacteria bacterium]
MLRSKGRRVAAAIIRPIWQRLPIAQSRKEELRNTLFSLCGCIFSFSGSYRAWKAARHCSEATTNSSDAFANDGLPATAADGQVLLDEQAPFVEKRIPCDLEHPKARLIAFYLPQFHTIPENDQWWGEGFTEWTNVRPAKPKFPGHYQPHEPVELGYYNLLDTETQVKQIALAKRYGIGGFCFYWYWFAGKRLLEKPVENWLNTPELDFPFCLCWANENWSRRWDGGDNELLMSQEHSPEDDLAFIAELAPYLMDRRYIRINGKPLIILYRPRLLPEPVETAGRWRSWCRENGIGEIYLAYTQSFEREDPGVYGFDAAIEFPPNIYAPKNLAERIPNLSDDFCGTIYDWRFYFARSYAYQRYPYTLFRCVCPSWDNTARSNNNSRILVNSTPADYRIWLENAISRTVTDATTPDERIIFCNAWNEWAEGAHLEPDTKYGYAFLDASRAALNSSERPAEVLLVGHDANPDGAQLLLLNLARSYSRNGMRVCILLLEGGQLLDEYQRVARVTVLKKAKGRDSEILHILRRLRSEHDQIAVVNTLASGVLLPQLKKTGYRCLSLVHEMTSASDKVCLEPAMHAIAEYADVVVFPTQVVRKQFEARLGRDLLPGKILPQELPQKPLPSAKGADPLQASCGSRETDFTCYTMDLLRLSGRVMPRVSVLVPNYNYGRYIEARLQSIQAQEYPIYEIIVLDDCSTDDSLARIHAFAATCARPLRIVENSENSGNVFRQWAKGIDMVRGDVVWIAEADDLAKPDFLSTVMRAFEDPATVLSYCDSIQVDEDDQVLATDYRYYTDPVSTTHWAEHYINPGEDEIARALYVKNTIPSVSGVVMATTPLREILAEHRSHLENVRFVGDWLVYLWLAERGAIAYNTASKNIHRRHHQNSVTLSSFGAAQLAEIKAVQEEVITRHRLGREQQDKAAAYLAELAAQFGLTAAEH